MYILTSLIALKYSLTIDKKILSVDGINETILKENIMESGPCTEYIKVILNPGIIATGSYVFEPCTRLETVDISSTVETISSRTFNLCTSLLTITFPYGTKNIQSHCFYGCINLRNVTFSASCVNIKLHGSIFQRCNSLENIFVAPGNPLFSTDDDHSILLYNKTVAVACVSSRNVTVPSYVEELGTWFAVEHQSLQYVFFAKGSNLITVNSGAFRLSGIKELALPESTLYIKDNIVEKALSLNIINLPSTLLEVHINAFTMVNKIDTFSVKGNPKGAKTDHETGAIYNHQNVCIFIPLSCHSYTLKDEMNLPKTLLQTARGLVDLTVKNHSKYKSHESLLYDNQNNLVACSGGLTRAVVADFCVSLLDGAFQCSGIEEISFAGNNVRSIGSNCLAFCPNLRSVIFNQNLAHVGDFLFMRSSLLEATIKFPSTLSSTKTYLFTYSSVKSVDFGDCAVLTKIDIGSFMDCKKLESVILPPNLQSIPKESFKGAICLKSISISNKTTLIDTEAFFGCISLQHINFEKESSLTSIGVNAFRQVGLISISIPNSVQTILQSALADCTQLTEIEFGLGSKLSALYGNAFSNTSIKYLNFGKHLKDVYQTAISYTPELLSINVSSENPNFRSIDGILYENGTQILKVCPGGLEKVLIKGNVKEFADSAFFGCTKLKQILFDTSSISAIGPSSFYGCTALEAIEIPNSVRELSDSSFFGCTSLSSVLFKNNSRLLSIGSGTFVGCRSLKSLLFEGSASLERICMGAFSECENLENISFVESLERIEDCAFEGCTRLQKIIFGGKMSIIGCKAFKGCSSLIFVHFSELITSIGFDSFRECRKLKVVEYCGMNNFTNESVFEEDMLDGIIVFVTPLYRYNTFCGLKILHSLDNDCLFATQKFTDNHKNHSIIFRFWCCMFEDE